MSTGIPHVDPLRYTGPEQNIVPIFRFQRTPLSRDTNFRVGTLALLGPNPSMGTQGELYYLSEFDSNGDAVWLQLLTGASAPGIDSITTDSGPPEVEPDGNGNVNVLGGDGIDVTGQGPGPGGNTVTITSTIKGLFTWTVITSATQAIAVSNGYFSNRGGGVTFTLPATAEVGDTIAISGINAGGWTINQNAGQTIRMGNQVTTTGAGGSLASTAIGDTVTMVCSQVNTDFQIISSMGNITIV